MYVCISIFVSLWAFEMIFTSCCKTISESIFRRNYLKYLYLYLIYIHTLNHVCRHKMSKFGQGSKGYELINGSVLFQIYRMI